MTALNKELVAQARELAISMKHSAGSWMVPGFDGYKVAEILEGLIAIVGTPSKEGAAQAEAVGYVTSDEIPEHRRAQLLPGVVVEAGAKLYTAPPASPSEGGGEPTPAWSRKMPLHPGCEHACQQAQDYGVWPESSCRPTCAYLAREPHPEDIEGNLAASRGEAVDAARYRVYRCTFTRELDEARKAYDAEALDAAIDAAIQSQGAKP